MPRSTVELPPPLSPVRLPPVASTTAGGITVGGITVGIVAHEMERQPTGVGRYLSGLLHGLQHCDHDWRWLLFFQGQRPPPGVPDDPRFESVATGRGGPPALWEQLLLPRILRRYPLDLLFCPAYSLPLRSRLPAVVSMHDLAFEVLPGEFDWRQRWRRRLLARHSARRARRLLTATAAMATHLRHTYGVEEERVGIVPVAPDPCFSAPGRDGDRSSLLELAERFDVRPPYLLHVGSLLERRRPDLLLELLRRLRRPRPQLQLVLAGPERLRHPQRFEEQIRRHALGPSLRRLGWVEEADLERLYRGAAATLYLSSYEGAGLPPLESLAAGTPAVVGPGLALDELCPDYAYCAPSLRLDDVVRTTERALAPDARSTVEGARRRLAAQTWPSSARILLAQLELALNS